MTEVFEALKGHNQLIDVLKEVIDSGKGELEFTDRSKDGSYSDLIVTSEWFNKGQLDVLFQYTDYPYVTMRKGKLGIYLSIDL